MRNDPTSEVQESPSQLSAEDGMPTNMLKWVGLSALVIAVDQVTKQVANHFLSYLQPVEVMPMLNWTLAYNKGAAFSFLADQPGWQRWFFATLAFCVSSWLLVWLYRLPKTQVWVAIALSLILGGAIGNLVDRLVYGYVIDFISFHWQNWYYPAFNIADTAISIGAGMLIIDIFKSDASQQDQDA